MMKSRGLRPANCARIALSSPLRAPRQFSTHASLRTPVLLRARSPLLALRGTPKASSLLRAPLAAGSTVSAIRFASTSPAAATSPIVENSEAAVADAAAAATANAPAGAASSSVDGVANEVLPDIANMPEQIGYLKAIGLDYGWGPTSCIEWLLEHVHIWGGLPWWSSIIVTAFIVRTSLFPLFARTSDVTARQQALREVTEPLNAKMNEARIAGNTDQMMVARAELMGVYKQAGISPWKAFYAPVAQAVTGYCTWKLLRAMAALPVPGLETGGFLWLQDLTVSDPYMILPLSFGALVHIVARSGGETGAIKQMTGLQKKLLFYIMPGLAILFTFAQPATVQLSFFAASTLGMLQARILRTPSVREALGLSPLVQPAPGPQKPRGVIDVDAFVTRPEQFRWQPPTVKSSVAKAGRVDRQAGILDMVRKPYDNTMRELKDFKDGIMKRAGVYEDNKAKRTQTKNFLKRAEDYEKKRQRELEMEAEFKRQRK